MNRCLLKKQQQFPVIVLSFLCRLSCVHVPFLFCVTGLKQGCAAMSDMSFVFTRNENDISFGIIAKCLQHEGGCYLPSFKLQKEIGVRQNLKEIFNHKDLAEVASCVAKYGMGSLNTGIQMLTDHINDLNSEFTWGSDKCVFKLVIADVHEVDNNKNKDGNGLFGGYDDVDSSDDEMGNRMEEEKMVQVVSSSSNLRRSRRSPSKELKRENQQTSNLTSSAPFKSVLNQLKEELPKYYIHIPPTLSILINSKQINFNYWQRHLIEIMRFDQKIGRYEPFHEREDLMSPLQSDVSFRIFCGFDPIREKDRDQATALSVYIYSRRSGRLIKYAEDGRNMLKLSAGGTQFCQGLTCIIDDHDGEIPLNPTKQDVAFSEKPNGEILGANLYAWTSAIVSIYYRFHLKKFDDKKGDLTLDLKPFAAALEQRYGKKSSESNSMKLLADCDFSSLSGMKWSMSYAAGTHKILAKMSHNIKEIDGIDSEFKLQGTALPARKKTKAKAKKSITPKGKDTKRKSNAPQSAAAVKKRKIPEKSHQSKKQKIICVDTSGSEYEDDVILNLSGSDDSEVNDFDKEDEKISDQGWKSSSKNSRVEKLMEELEQAQDTIAKKQHDYDRLVDELESVRGDNRRLTDENEDLSATQRSTSGDDNYNMLMEVKKNLQNENDQLTEEIAYLKGEKEELARQLKAEKSLRASVEHELSVAITK